jgi:hypothetical protein
MIAYFDTIFYALPAIVILAVSRCYPGAPAGRHGQLLHLRQVAGVAVLMTPLSLLLLDSVLRAPGSLTFVMWPLPAPYLGLNLLIWFVVWCGAAFFWIPRRSAQ